MGPVKLCYRMEDEIVVLLASAHDHRNTATSAEGMC